jgi:hypothetical protein
MGGLGRGRACQCEDFIYSYPNKNCSPLDKFSRSYPFPSSFCLPLQKRRRLQLQIYKPRNVQPQDKQLGAPSKARSSRGAWRMRLALLGSVWLGSSSLLDCEVSDGLQVKNVGSRG